MSRLRDLLALSDLKRWNVVPTSRDQTVAQHCYRVAVVAMEIVDHFTPPDPLDYPAVLHWALVHDGPECLTGDLPSAFKDQLDIDDLRAAERRLCPWYEHETPEATSFAYTVVSIAEAIESSSWLAQFGLSGTEPLVADLRQKVFSRCDMANLTWPGLGAAGRTVAKQVWRTKFPLKLRGEKENHNAAGSGATTGPTADRRSQR